MTIIRKVNSSIIGTTRMSNAFGPYEVLDAYTREGFAKSRFLIRFTETDTVCEVSEPCLYTRNVKDPMVPNVCGKGFMGIGPHKGWHGGKVTKEYTAWKNMMKRCYNEVVQKKQPTYRGCSVDTRWHNFQTFCEDIKTLIGYEEWLVNPGMALDKDGRVPGNKIYSVDTCQFITQAENSRLAVAAREAKKAQSELNDTHPE